MRINRIEEKELTIIWEEFGLEASHVLRHTSCNGETIEHTHEVFYGCGDTRNHIYNLMKEKKHEV